MNSQLTSASSRRNKHAADASRYVLKTAGTDNLQGKA